MFYKKGIDITNDKQMFNFLKDHYTYDTLNSWNGLKSIANCVKIYDLGLEGDCWNALKYLQQDDYFDVNSMLEDWEREHSGYRLGFNGRSGGYIVMYNDDNNCSILPVSITYCNDYEEYKTYCKDYYGSVRDARGDLKYYTKLVQSFDKLCDTIRDYVNELSKRNFALDSADLITLDFNDDYYDDLKELGIDEVSYSEVDGEVRIDTKEIKKHRALYEALINTVRSKVDDYKIEKDYIIIKNS